MSRYKLNSLGVLEQFNSRDGGVGVKRRRRQGLSRGKNFWDRQQGRQRGMQGNRRAGTLANRHAVKRVVPQLSKQLGT